ncbi:hypothetical protein [Mucilaginibacter aquariorum]|uniref:Uncharacterized protein n=1 Tax=Mucilaginibacter aquariorum TaxID=2967225 RepID=A0ABT1T2E9_9SPHI|nr:hypothetical protein [Mucilaginibacter aquariorum]MCQ6958744.1 hypothetical protein [Mucilaginibacter aquariorum]
MKQTHYRTPRRGKLSWPEKHSNLATLIVVLIIIMFLVLFFLFPKIAG